jgi:hypothetical protein
MEKLDRRKNFALFYHVLTGLSGAVAEDWWEATPTMHKHTSEDL